MILVYITVYYSRSEEAAPMLLITTLQKHQLWNMIDTIQTRCF